MSAGAIVFIVVFWGALIWITVYCFAKMLKGG